MSIQDLIQIINTQLPDNNQQLITEAILRGVLENMVNTLSSELRVFNINSSQVTDNGDGTYTITVTNPLDDALAIDEKLNIYEYNGTNWVAKVVDLILSATGDDGVEIDDSDPNNIVVKLTQATLDSLALADSAVQPGNNVSQLNNDVGYLNEAAHDNLPQDNPHGVTKAQVGLGNVDNTSDADKPVSTAQSQAISQAEADAKQYTDDEINALNLGSASQADVGDFATSAQGTKADTAIQPGDDISKLNNDSEYIDAARVNMNINTIGVTTWDRDTGVLTWGKCYIYTNKVQRWILDPGSITLSSGRSVVLTANSDGTFSDPNAIPNSGTVYLCNLASASNFSSQEYYLIGSAYTNTSLGGLSWDPLYNAFVPAITIPNSPTYLQWNNVGVNKSSIASFINRRSTQDVNDINLLNVIIAGSSTVGRVGNGDGTPDPPYSPEFATKNYPPAGYKQGLSKVLYDNLKFENQDIEYIPHDNLNWIFSGDWVDVERVDKHKLKRTSTQGDYCEITVTGCVHFRLVCENWKPSIQNGCDISIQVDVNSTGFVTPSSLSIGPDSYDLNTGKAYAEKFFRIYFGELDASDTYTFRFTKNDAGDGEFGVWGAEHWTGKNLIVYNTGWGGYNTLNMLENYAGLLGSENIQPDVIFFVMTVSNDISRAKGGYPISSIQSQVDDLCRYLSELDVEVLTFIQHPLTSADNPSDADYEIGQLITNIHRSSAAKYGLGCVDMFEKGIIAFGNGEEWRYDATHLVSEGIDAYIEEINRIVFSNTNGSSNTIKQCKHGTVLSGEPRTVTFDKPYLGAPRVEIQPYNDGTAPEFMYINSVTKNGFEVSGNGAFFWKSYPV